MTYNFGLSDSNWVLVKNLVPLGANSFNSVFKGLWHQGKQLGIHKIVSLEIVVKKSKNR